MTIPKELRERLGIRGGDDVVGREEDGKVVVEKPVTRADLAEGYRARAERGARLDEEMEGVSAEADGALGDVPEW